MWHYYSSAQIQ
jgi:hypothetical protein